MFMEERFGLNFSRVQIHTGTQAAAAARTIGDQAYVGAGHIVFGAGAYPPHTFE